MELTGTILKNRYCVIGPAGRGGSGTLYLAKDLELSTIWAVKQIPREKRTEARMLRRLSFPHIPRMVDYFEQGDACFLVMEYIEGIPLDRMQDKKQLNYNRVLSYLITILETLQYLHTLKPPICYADLKPSNLILSKEQKLYLVDFGSAGPSTHGSPAGQSEGTPGFAAPEQYRGIRIPASDLYGLGKTAQKLVAGKRLLLHPELWLFIRRCTRTDPENRFQDAAAAKRLLNAMQRGRRLTFAGGMAAFLLILLLQAGRETGREELPQKDLLSDRTENNGEEKSSDSSREPDFWQELTRITDAYLILASGSGQESGKEVQELLTQAETRLVNLLEHTQEPDTADRLLKTLAAQARLSGREDQTEVYYLQAMEICPQDDHLRGLYGRFLLQNNRTAESLQLWKRTAAELGKEKLMGKKAGREAMLWTKELGLLCE